MRQRVGSVWVKDRGSKTVAAFGGVEVLLKLATFACQESQAGSGRRCPIAAGRLVDES